MYSAFLEYPVYYIGFYILEALTYTLIGRVLLGLFTGPNSEFFIMRFFRMLTDPVIRLFRWVTPPFLVPVLVPLYVAFWLWVFRLPFRLLMLQLEMAPPLPPAG